MPWCPSVNTGVWEPMVLPQPFLTNKEHFLGRPLKTGNIVCTPFPEADHWVVTLNTEYGAFGYSEPDYSKDVMRVNVVAAQLLSPVEQFTIELNENDGNATLSMRWDTTAVTVPSTNGFFRLRISSKRFPFVCTGRFCLLGLGYVAEKAQHHEFRGL